MSAGPPVYVYVPSYVLGRWRRLLMDYFILSGLQLRSLYPIQSFNELLTS